MYGLGFHSGTQDSSESFQRGTNPENIKRNKYIYGILVEGSM